MPRHFRFPILTLSFAAVIAGTGACGGGETEAEDTVATDTGAAMTTPPSDTSAMPGGMNRTPARDADHEFLRGMTDHHQGLIAMATEAMNKGSTPEAKADAHKLHVKQDAESKEMMEKIRSQYSDSMTPMVMPKHKAMNDSLQAKTGADYDRTFYHHVVQHHREGVGMIDQFMPRLTKPDVRQMAEKMKADQQKEIAEFERKMNAVRS